MTFRSQQLEWCDSCKSNHTAEFGAEFHDRIIEPRPVAQVCDWPELRGINLQVGDIVAVGGAVHKKRWWQFWRGDRIEHPMMFKVTTTSKNGQWKTLNRV